MPFEGGAWLALAVPESDYAPLAFTCETGKPDVIFAYEFEPAGAEEGMQATIVLRAGDIEVPIETTGARLEMNEAFLLEGVTPLDDRLIDLITSRGTLTVTVAGNSEDFDLDGAREAAQSLIEACRP